MFQCVHGKIWDQVLSSAVRRSSRSHLVMMLFLGSRDMNTGRVQFGDGEALGVPKSVSVPNWMVYQCSEQTIRAKMDDLGLPFRF